MPAPSEEGQASSSTSAVSEALSVRSMQQQQDRRDVGAGSVVPSSLFFTPITCRGNQPPGRWAHCAVNVGAHQMVVFGGVGSSMLGDLWLLDMEAGSWRALQPSCSSAADQPEKLMAAAAAAVGGRIWIFGGQKGRTHTRKLHVLDMQRLTWRQPPCRGSLPCARAGHAMTTVGTSIWMFGGLGKKLLNDLYCLDTTSPELEGTFLEVKPAGGGQPPLGRQGMTFLHDGGDLLVCWGGTSTAGIDNALAVFSLQRGTWQHPQQRGRVPSPRTNHAAALISPHIILICGGCNASGTFFADCHILDTLTFTWHQPQSLNPGFAPRYNHSLCLGPNGRAYMYGGVNAKQTFDSLVTIDTRDSIGDDLSAVAAELESLARSSASTTARESCDSSFSNREMDLMRIQLTDMLYKRNMEEHLHNASSRVEASEQQLNSLKEQLERATTENRQLGLLCLEAEAARRSEQQAVREAEARASKASQALADAQAAHDVTKAELARLQAEAEAAKALHEDHVKELGLLSSRHTKLQQQYSAVCRRLSMLGDRSTVDASQLSSRSLPEGGPAASLTTDDDSCGPSTGPSATLSSSTLVCVGPQGMSDIGEGDTSTLLAEAQAEAAQLREQLGAAVSERDGLQEELQQMTGQPRALQGLPLSKLQQLEQKLDLALRTVREAALQRRISEVEQRAVAEQQSCSLCMERPRSLVFNCGHQSCEKCGETLPACPFCRKEITLRVKLFTT